MPFLIEDMDLGEVILGTLTFASPADFWNFAAGGTVSVTTSGTGKWGYAHPLIPASIYPCATPVSTAPSGDWVGTDETGYTSEKLKSRIMPVGEGVWWAKLGEQWVTITDPESPDYGAQVEFPSARMAREQVERRREAERG